MWVCMVSSVLVLKHKQKYFRILVPINTFIFMVATANGGSYYDNYRIAEYMLANISLMACQVIIVPTLWKLNCFSFSLGCVIFAVITYRSYENVAPELFMGTFFCALFFNWFCYLSYHKLNMMFEIILENEKLVMENRKIIEAFPHAVIIESKNDFFTNLEFDKKFKIVANKLEELGKLLVKIDEEHEQREDEFGFEAIKNCEINNLDQCLRRQVARLRHSDVIEQHSVFIKNNYNHDEVNQDRSNFERREEDEEKSVIDTFDRFNKGKYCNIKTMKVLWNRKPSVMHVFIDTTNILKLEEANNNIKCQKIMFTSASHEFRTPLNSIVNA
jgi:hypothetical protein